MNNLFLFVAYENAIEATSAVTKSGIPAVTIDTDLAVGFDLGAYELDKVRSISALLATMDYDLRRSGDDFEMPTNITHRVGLPSLVLSAVAFNEPLEVA